MNNEELTIKDIISELQIVANSGFNIKDVFRSFMEVSAISIYNSIAKDPKLEKQYMSSVKKYGRDNMHRFSKCFSILVELLQKDYQDYLGQISVELSTLDGTKGQIFTPLNIAEYMAKASWSNDHITKLLKNPNNYIKVLEPSAGTGVFLVAIARIMVEDIKLNFQEKLWLVAWELDQSIFYGLYVQASLMGFSAHIVNGNTLTQEKYEEWITPVGYAKRWSFKSKSCSMHRLDTIKKDLRDKTINRVATLIYELSKKRSNCTYRQVRLMLIAGKFKSAKKIPEKIKIKTNLLLEKLGDKKIISISEITNDLQNLF